MIMTPHGEERGAAARLEPRGPARVNKILTSRSSGGFRQYIVRVYGGFAVFCGANALEIRRRRKSSGIINLKN
jgi:hypothetical protein